MNISLQQLSGNLNQHLMNVYYVAGDEPLQKEEAVKLIRQAAVNSGFTERVVLDVDKKFDWGLLLAESQSMSLFGDKRLIELRMPQTKPGDKGSKAIVSFMAECPDDVMLLIVSGKLDKPQLKSKWFKAIDAKGVCIQIWPIDKAQLPRWVTQRMAALKMQASPDALELLCDRVEGNLLAAEQALEKLFLLNGEGEVDMEAVRDLVADSARYNVFQLVDSSLNGEASQSVKILDGLQGEGVDPVIIVWALAREIRSLVSMSLAMNEQSLEQVIKVFHVWQKRQNCIKSALSRHKARQWQLFLWQLSELDKLNKGLKTGNIWHELIQLVLKIAGNPLMPAQRPKQAAYSY
ncbi:DNA polymerase III delta subunit [hydrothermal vent metagenome]|uniref:DNA polymerase III subunit delta n=1 Tax=hydrothermal vent metagenome TaxID=652676 RepID=A0A3B1AVX1_9ZZZZ